MKVIYHCWGGSHSSIVCAAIHLGLLPTDRPPTPAELMALDRFDRQTSRDHGRIIYMGRDECGHEVYVLGRRSNGPVIDRILPGVAVAFGIPRDEIATFNTMHHVNPVMVIGGTLSRGLGLVWPGRPIVIYGVRLAHPGFCRAVAAFKRRLADRRPAGRGAFGRSGADVYPIEGRPAVANSAAAMALAAELTPQASDHAPSGREAEGTLIFYHCYASAHSSVVAAAIHLGRLPTDRRPRAGEITALPRYDRVGAGTVGTPFRCGTDADGNIIYVVGMIRGMRVIRRAVRCLLQILGLPQGRLLFVDCTPLVNIWMRVGGFLSRQLGLIRVGRPLTVVGVVTNYDGFAAKVACVKSQLRRRDGR